MNLNQLRVFKAISDAMSITGAARLLRISQPAVSKQLAELEQALGTPLVDRLSRGIQLTAAGNLLASHARRIFQAEHEAEGALAELLGLEGGSLSVGASTTIGSYLVPRVLGDFHTRHPKVNVQLVIGNTQAITEALLDRQIDVGLTEGLIPGESLDQDVLTHDDMVLITNVSHPLANKPRASLADLTSYPLICREQGSGTREVIEAALARQGLQIAPAMSLGSTEAVKNAVLHGFGIAMVSRLTVELELSSRRLRALEVDGLQIRRALHLLTLKGKHPSPSAGAFLQLLRAYYARKS